jgi:NADH-quinone oxidoreductase subunit N
MIDHVALLPAYLAAGTAVLVLLVDLVAPGRPGPVLGSAALGAIGTVLAAILVGPRPGTFCAAPGACSYVFDSRAALVAVLFAGLTLGVLALSAPLLRSGTVPTGEYCFLLTASMTGGVVLGAARDLITLIVALETLTLPLYVLVGLRRRSSAAAPDAGRLTADSYDRSGPRAMRCGPDRSPLRPLAADAPAQAAVTFFVVSVVSTAVALLGAALLYAGTGSVHFGQSTVVVTGLEPVAAAGAGLLLVGLSFKVAAVPLHAWAPPTYDGAPLPIAAYLSTASKLGGVIALVQVTTGLLTPQLRLAGLVLAVLSVLTMTVGNLVALRQQRMVRLLAWSSVAQAGYILAPLGALTAAVGRRDASILVAATLAYTVFYVLMELGAFGAVVALRGADDGGQIAEYRGVARRSPWPAAALGLALAGLAGLPPGLAGLFAKVTVVRALLDGGTGWLAIAVALNAVVGLAYYVRVAATLFGGEPAAATRRPVSWVVAGAVAAVTAAALVVGFAPQLVLDVVGR